MTTHVKVPEGLTEEQIEEFCIDTIIEKGSDGWLFCYEKNDELIFTKHDHDEHEQHHDDMADMADMWRKSRQEDRS